jgi:hypothetical protein
MAGSAVGDARGDGLDATDVQPVVADADMIRRLGRLPLS